MAPRDKATVHKGLGNVVLVIEELRKAHPAMTANGMLAFLNIAMKPGSTVSDIQKTLALNSSSAVRSIALLTQHHRGGKSGLDLVKYEADVADRRVKHLYLKPQGERVWNTIKRILEVPAA